MPLPPMMQMAIVLSVVNSLILLLLVYVYTKMASRTRATYSYGLLIFALLLLLQSVATAIGYTTQAAYFADEALPLMYILQGFELGGLLVLARITL